MLNKFNWAILGCGNIANDFAREMNKMGGKVYSVANRTYEKAKVFAVNIGNLCRNIKETKRESVLTNQPYLYWTKLLME